MTAISYLCNVPHCNDYESKRAFIQVYHIHKYNITLHFDYVIKQFNLIAATALFNHLHKLANLRSKRRHSSSNKTYHLGKLSHNNTHKHLDTHSNTPMADHSTYSEPSNCFQMSKLSSPPFASLRLHFGSCVFSLRSTAKLRTHSSCVFVCVYEFLHLEISSMWYSTLTGVISKEEENAKCVILLIFLLHSCLRCTIKAL